MNEIKHYRCRKCGELPSRHYGDHCSGLFDRFHTVGLMDLVRVDGPADYEMSADDRAAFVHNHFPVTVTP